MAASIEPIHMAGFGKRDSTRRNALMLFLASFLAFYFELVVIRYVSTEIRVFAYLKNLALVASFFGIGLGMILADPRRTNKNLFPIFAPVLFLLAAFASNLGLTHLPVPGNQYEMFGHSVAPWGSGGTVIGLVLGIWLFFAAVPAILYLVVLFFLPLGGLVGERLARLEPLSGYGWNLAGSLAGILAFTAVSFSTAPPVMWILLGLRGGGPLFPRAMVVPRSVIPGLDPCPSMGAESSGPQLRERHQLSNTAHSVVAVLPNHPSRSPSAPGLAAPGAVSGGCEPRLSSSNHRPIDCLHGAELCRR